MKLLLIGATGSPYYEHCKPDIIEFLRPSKRIGVITAANLVDEEAYFQGLEERLTRIEPRIMGELIHIRWASNPLGAVRQLDAVIVPGGNTYALLKRLCQSGLLDLLREEIRQGLRYIGSSAGANITGPNILTTNDWNVVGLTRFDSLAVVPFNVNPHYIERAMTDAPHSETRDARIQEYHKLWNNPVIGLEEAAVLRVTDVKIMVRGTGRVKLFARAGERSWLEPGCELPLGALAYAA